MASNIGGTPEAVLHEETGLIIKNINDLYSALQNILSDNKKMEKLGQNAKIRAEKYFLWRNVVKKYLHIIDNIDKKNFLKTILRYKKIWEPYCTVATWYLWRDIDEDIVQY